MTGRACGVWMFPGQGNQYEGMLHAISNLPTAAEVLAEASDVLDQDALQLDSAESLAGTRGAQLAMLLTSVASARELLERGVEPTYVAGHSLGSWSAAVVTDVLTLADAVRLVAVRGQRMSECSPPGYGMAAIVGLSTAKVVDMADQVRAAGHNVWASNRNTPDQTAVSGSPEALDKVLELARAAGATKAVRLRVVVPAHSPMMQPVAEELSAALANISLGSPRWPLAGNTNGRLLRTGPNIARDLAEATAAPVAWAAITATLRERGIGYWLQMLPGHDLVGMILRQWPEDRAWCLDDVASSESSERIRHLGRTVT